MLKWDPLPKAVKGYHFPGAVWMTSIEKASSPIQTNWHVVTGAPCAGKTAVIDELARRGYWVVPEAARAYIDQRIARGLSLADIKSNIMDFERRILMLKVAAESALPTDHLVFLDRAIPDSIAYYRMEGLAPEEPVMQSALFRYKTVFLLERLHFEKDRVRTETEESVARIEALLERCYREMGYAPVRVPVMSIDGRAAFILNHLSERGVISL